ncbi:hypothetical protein M8J77_025889 [Diaphorina citri]|nr:hypothetical protein M8J77_025889 [Diaphorina citri]
MKFLIDTGANASYLTTTSANKFPFIKEYEPCKITTATGSHNSTHSITVPNGYLFKSKSIPHSTTFFIFDFHEFFDGLLGSPDLKKINLNILLDKNLLQNKKISLRLRHRVGEQELNNISTLLRLSHLDSLDDKERIVKILEKFPNVILKENEKLSFTSLVKHEIPTIDETPVYSKNYRYPPVHKNEIRNQVESLLEQGIIRPSHSPWSSPVHVVRKKLDASGKPKWRMVVDYRNVNSKTITDKYPMPNIEDLLDRLHNCKYFSTIDLASGFHQIEMDPKSIAKTAFNAGTSAHFEYVRMPFGLKNAPATFQRCMNEILQSVPNTVVYLDDILLFTENKEDHFRILELIMKRLSDHNMKLQLDKSEFLKTETTYLGHVISSEGAKPNPEKLRCIEKYPIPRTTTQIKSFLGLVGYYRKYIKDFAKVAKPLTACLKKDAIIDIKDIAYNEAFHSLKSALMNEPVLKYPNFSKQFTLTTDASNFAIGAVLSQDNHPIAYASRTLNEHEKNYSTIEKELLAIVWATKHYRPYLFGQKFKIITDHRPLTWLINLKEPSSKLVRWRLKLEEYDYEIEYKPGKQNSNADALSRIEIHNDELIVDNEDAMDCETINTAAADPEAMSQSQNDGTIHSNRANPIVGIEINSRSPLNIYKNQILVKTSQSPKNVKIVKVFDKKRLTLHITPERHETEMNTFIKEFLKPKRKYAIYFEDKTDETYVKFTRCLQKNFKTLNLKITKVNTLLIDVNSKEEQEKIVEKYHTGLTNHRGSNEVHAEVYQKYFWPNMKRDITKLINACEPCKLNKYERHPVKYTYNVTPTESQPMQKLHLDIVTIESNKVLSIIDPFSKFAQCYPLTQANSISITDKLMNFFSSFGIPQTIVTDNGTEFTNNVMEEFLKSFGIELHITAIEHPQSNGVVERFHSTLREHYRLITNDPKRKDHPFPLKLNYCILAYNNSIHSTTKQKPIDLIHGYKINPLTMNDNISKEQYINQHKEYMKDIYENIRKIEETEKQKRTNKTNINRSDPSRPFASNEEIIIKERASRYKTKPLYYPGNVVEDNVKRKTVVYKNRKQPFRRSKIHYDRVRKKTKT